jgi:hypothetical protein
MPKSTSAKKNLLKCQNSVFFLTWSLSLFIGVLMLLGSVVDPESLEIHDLISEPLGVPSFLSSKRVFPENSGLIFNPGFSGAGHDLWAIMSTLRSWLLIRISWSAVELLKHACLEPSLAKLNLGRGMFVFLGPNLITPPALHYRE